MSSSDRSHLTEIRETVDEAICLRQALLGLTVGNFRTRINRGRTDSVVTAPYGGISVFVKHGVDTLEVRFEQTLDQRVQTVSLEIRLSSFTSWLTSLYGRNASCVGALGGLLEDLMETLSSHGVGR